MVPDATLNTYKQTCILLACCCKELVASLVMTLAVYSFDLKCNYIYGLKTRTLAKQLVFPQLQPSYDRHTHDLHTWNTTYPSHPCFIEV